MAAILSAVPSYLGELVVAARRRGMGPSDFSLRRIDVGGEVLSPSLAAAARSAWLTPSRVGAAPGICNRASFSKGFLAIRY